MRMLIEGMEAAGPISATCCARSLLLKTKVALGSALAAARAAYGAEPTAGPAVAGLGRIMPGSAVGCRRILSPTMLGTESRRRCAAYMLGSGVGSGSTLRSGPPGGGGAGRGDAGGRR